MRKLNVSLKPKEILSVNRIHLTNERLVYILIASKHLHYRHGKSPIAYIGTTEKGLARIAESAAFHADEILGVHGITSVVARVVTCKPRKKVKTWRKLERALLFEFREMYGEVPNRNRQGKKVQLSDEFKYFNKGSIRRVIERFAY